MFPKLHYRDYIKIIRNVQDEFPSLYSLPRGTKHGPLEFVQSITMEETPKTEDKNRKELTHSSIILVFQLLHKEVQTKLYRETL